jgi:GrpB-like predicted nucleotidyltransferase (UPF0157 family)
VAETLEQKIARVLREEISLVPYDPAWPEAFRRERDHLLECLPNGLLGRIEHFGSTAVPGLTAKPVVDMLVEVTDLEAVKARVVPLLEAQGYDYFWRATIGEDGPPFYAWFIRRDPDTGRRTHHLHMVEHHFPHWESLRFRDRLIARPDIAREYEALKRQLADEHARDRIAYTRGKAAFIERVTADTARD